MLLFSEQFTHGRNWKYSMKSELNKHHFRDIFGEYIKDSRWNYTMWKLCQWTVVQLGSFLKAKWSIIVAWVVIGLLQLLACFLLFWVFNSLTSLNHSLVLEKYGVDTQGGYTDNPVKIQDRLIVLPNVLMSIIWKLVLLLFITFCLFFFCLVVFFVKHHWKCLILLDF